MNLVDFISEDLVVTGLLPENKKDICEKLLSLLMEKGKIDESRRSVLLEKLMEREELSSTGIGGGVGIPHAGGEAIDKIALAIGQVPSGVDFNSIDGEPVKLVFLIIGSEGSAKDHLRLLASIVRTCKNKELLKKLSTASSPKELYGALLENGG